jgi:hypothetical protein
MQFINHIAKVSCLVLIFHLSLFAEYSVMVESLSGRAEIQRAGQQGWTVVKKGVSLQNNDIFRTQEKCVAMLRSADGDTLIIHPNSQILVNSVENTQAGTVNRTITVFFGAVFFIVEKVLPKGLFRIWDFKTYSPTSVVAVRGSAFCMEVDKKTGSTVIRSIEGTILVKNILRNGSFYLTYPNQTTVALNTDPTPPRPFSKKEIDQMYTWIPQDIIDGLIAKQITKLREDRQKIVGGLEDKIIVMPLANNSKYSGAWDIGAKLADAIQAMLIRANVSMSIIIAGLPGDDPVKTGAAANGRFIVTGEVTDLSMAQFSEPNAAATEINEYNVAKFKVQLRLVDASEKKQLYESVFEGEVSGKIMDQNNWETISRMAFDINDSTFSSSIMGKAIRQALDQSIAEISQYLPK